MKLKNNISLQCLLVMMVALCLSSCKSVNRNTVYFQNADELSMPVDLPQYAIRIKPDDELRIIISSSMPDATLVYNFSPFTESRLGQKDKATTLTTTTYLVQPNGKVTLPVLGDIEVAGKTTLEVKEMILARLVDHVIDPIVSVDMMSMSALVLGRVDRPGRVSFTHQRYSVLDALAQCGDVRLDGKKQNIRLVREENGKAVTHVLDLTDANIISSPYYYLQQNDVLIVDASVAAKSNAEYNQMNSFKISVISTCVSTLSVIVSMAIALLK